MSNFQIPVLNQAQAVSSTQGLTGCLYHIVQSPGPQGRNVLNLIPVLKSKDNTLPVVATSTIPNAGTVNLQQPIGFALPSAVSNVALPCQVNAPLIQQLGTGKYVITSQKSPIDTSKTIRVDSSLSALQGTNFVLEKSGLNLPSTSTPGTQTIIMMNTKSPSVPVKAVPLLPSGHGLQIPAHAEVKTVPASSLPFSIQQRILPQLNHNDATKIPSVIYVSPVNTVKTSNNKAPLTPPRTPPKLNMLVKQSPLLPILPLTSQSKKTDAPKGPMKWVVEESTESSCIVPVTSSSNTASKLLKMMTGTKAEDINLPNTSTSKMVQIKDNALVVCNNKIYFLTKQGAELRGADNINTEPSIKTSNPTDQKVPSVVPAEAVLSKNVSPPTPQQTINTSREPLFSPPKDTAAKSKIWSRSKTNGIDPEVICIDDDDDDDESVQRSQSPLCNLPGKSNLIKASKPWVPPAFGSHWLDHSQMQLNPTSSYDLHTSPAPQDYASKRNDDRLHNQTDKTSSINVCTAAAPPAYGSVRKGNNVRSYPNKMNSIKVCASSAKSDCGPNIKDNQVREGQRVTIAEKPLKTISDDSLRIKFGLVKKEKIMLSRYPLLSQLIKSASREPSSSSSYLEEEAKAHTESLDKRKSTFSETEMDSSSKRRKSDDPNINHNTPESNYSASTSSTITVPASMSSSHVMQTSGQRQCSSPVSNEDETSMNHESAMEMYSEPTESDSYYFEQDTAEHFGEVSAPTQRFIIENSAYPDETTKDEKIQRLKEVLKEREQALEALRRLTRP